jgi:hypothetical protein
MTRRTTTFAWAGVGGLCGALALWNLGAAQAPTPEAPPKGPTYMRVLEEDFATVRARDVTGKGITRAHTYLWAIRCQDGSSGGEPKWLNRTT